MRSSAAHDHYDAIVVGARVAGAATAMLLARQGKRVLALDRAPFGTDTVSTHALMKGGVLQLHRWGLLDRIVASGAPPLRRTVVHYPDGNVELAVKDDGDVDALYAPRRTVLDPMLADAAEEAGAELRFDSSVTSVDRGPNGEVVGVTYRTRDGRSGAARAPITIGADGARSLVARAVDAPFTRTGTHASAVVYAYFDARGFDGFEWYFQDGGGAGLAPTNDGVLAYVAFPPTRFAEVRQPTLEVGFWRALRRHAAELADALVVSNRTSRFHVHRGLVGFHRQPAGRGWALVGDASHFKDPISAHGLTDALRDAELLARALHVDLTDAAEVSASLAAYGAERDRLATPLFDIADRVASHQWSSPEIVDLLTRMSRHLADECAEIRAWDERPVGHPSMRAVA